MEQDFGDFFFCRKISVSNLNNLSNLNNQELTLESM